MKLPDLDKPSQDTSTKPGVGDVAMDLGKSFIQSAVISPVWNGLGQLVSGGRLPQVTITNEENAKHSSADAWAQKIGSAAGMAVDFAILAKFMKGGVAAGAEAQTASSISLAEKSWASLGQGLKIGATYGAVFVPSAPGDNIALGRIKNAASNGITFGALAGLSELAGGVGVLGKMQPGTLAHAVKDIGVTGAVGLPSGVIGAEANSIINNGTGASWTDMKEQAVNYGIIGVVFSSLTHGASIMGGARSTSLPLAKEAAIPIGLRAEPTAGGRRAELPDLASLRAQPTYKMPSIVPSDGNLSSTPLPSLRAQSPPSGPRSPISLAELTKPDTPSLGSEGEHLGAPPRTGVKSSLTTSEVKAELNADRGTPVVDEMHDLIVGRIHKLVYADGTHIENHIDSRIKVTTLPDQTKITETPGGGVTTEYPDGSETKVTAYRTEHRSVDGKWTFEYNHWCKGWENWENLKPEQKRDLLTTLDQIPPGGRLTGSIVQKGLGESDLALQQLAIDGILHIPDPEEQVYQWTYAHSYNEPFIPQLIDMLPRLAQESRERILSGYGASMSGVFDGLAENSRARGASDPTAQAAQEYLDMIQGFSKSTRKRIWDALNESIEHPKEYPNNQIQPYAGRIMTALESGSRTAVSAFGEFAKLPSARFNAIDTLEPGTPTRADISVKAPESSAKTFERVRDVLLAADKLPEGEAKWNAIFDARREAEKLLKENKAVDLKKMFADWGRDDHSDWIKDFVDRQLSPYKRFSELRDEFIRLAQKDPQLSQVDASDDGYHMNKVMESPFQLDKRAPEYYVTRDQIEATLQHSLQLLQIADANRTTSGELSRAGQQFRMAGLQLMAQAGDPLLIQQGAHPTCALAQLELSTFLKHPDEAARMVNEIMRTGKFVTQDGSVISIDAGSMRPEDGSLEPNRTINEKVDYKYRSYISQLFETGAANIYWQRQTTVPDGTGRQVPVGSLRYEVHFVDAYNKAGQYLGKKPEDALMDYSQKPAKQISDGPVIKNLSQIQDIGEQIGGTRTKPNVTMTVPKTVDEFQRYLASLPYPESFPLIMPIDAKALQNPNLPYGGINHAISILVPWQSGGRIYFSNTWEPDDIVSNHLDRNRFWEISKKQP